MSDAAEDSGSSDAVGREELSVYLTSRIMISEHLGRKVFDCAVSDNWKIEY
jgi:hypothetical protein